MTPDTGGYRAAADAFRASLTSAGPADLPPLFPLLLAVAPDEGVVLAVLVLVSAAIPPLLAIAARRHYGPVGAWTAGLFAALSPTLVMWTPYLLTDMLGLFFAAITIERSSAAWTRDTRARGIHLGLAAAAAILTRAALATSLIAVVAVGVAQRRIRLVTLALLAAVVLVAIPSIRNAAAVGEPIPYRSQTLLLLWAGTTWDERGRGTGGIDIIYPVDHEKWDRARRDDFYSQEIRRALEERPADVASRAARKVLWLWLPFYPDWSLLHQIVNGTYFLLAYTAATYGAFAQRKCSLTSLLIVHLVLVTAVAAATIVDFDARYRLPAELSLIVLGGAGIAALVKRARA